ncbi:hypothetical protein NEOLEDRAFT_1183710 [Neolentinus lepideus HHB14362 ss-1]|uniref:Uncharacterized protein n=1 Tax=Neolentinus lepideus HHB14362 ss-1 TaxID=1314782 RepID=A0A165N223_9AGAM|nr:hypothetical protein NEOLEDRAFT_1183710 [Neolentinus lepideus HHB14362 ss-1]
MHIKSLSILLLDYYNPTASSLLDSVGGGLGVPLSMIISGMSSADILTIYDVVNFSRAIGLSEKCFGIHSGDPQTANLRQQ